METSALGPDYAALFAALEKTGFACSVLRYEPEAVGNFVVVCSSTAGNVRVTNDRGQIFIDFGASSGAWVDKEVLLGRLGLLRDRHPTTEHGLWRGYEPGIQAAELEKYLPELLREVTAALADTSLDLRRER
jgi:hypothetical protein